jgi:hypothetical protein
VLIGR